MLFSGYSTTLNYTMGCLVRPFYESVNLSLYLNSEANASRLLTKVHLFEKLSGLRIALTKSFVTAVMHGKGTELRTSGAT